MFVDLLDICVFSFVPKVEPGKYSTLGKGW